MNVSPNRGRSVLAGLAAMQQERGELNRRERERRAARDSRYAVDCPHCGATRGDYCRNPGGYTVPVHKVRERAAG